MEEAMSGTVLILGASGIFGGACARAFAQAGWQVRRYDRKAGNMAAAAQGADLIVNGLNPPNYHDWDNLLPKITAEVLTAAEASGATVLLPGNVYVFGKEPGPWSDTTPHRPLARKGRLRAELEAAYRAAAARGARVIVLRGGDFIDGTGRDDVMAYYYLRGVKSGKVTGLAGVTRAHAFLPDFARAAVALAERRAELPEFADIPYPGHAFDGEALRAEVQRQTGRKMRLAAFPWTMIRLLSPFWELARELGEMRYLYETPHRIDGSTFRALFPDWHDTPFEKVVAASLKGKVDPDQAVARDLAA
jgi:nucleoside-diphosphate-sugar epimerase